uniref:Uncharacterized protein n=1 Tax=Anguilla anguilla TaxID=7936 RepID=A0A0E9PQI7_ANGAN
MIRISGTPKARARKL